MKQSLCFLILTFIAACGKEPKTLPNQGVTQENFSAMSSEEIMRVKYDNEIDLICDLRVHDGPYVDLNYKPSKTLVWKLTQELAKYKKISFEFRARTYTVEIQLASKLRIHNLNYVDSQGDSYSMTYSPTIDISYRSLMTTGEVRDFYEEKDFTGETKLFENVPTVVYSLTSENMETGETVSEDLRCQLKTKTNPAYADQWMRR